MVAGASAILASLASGSFAGLLVLAVGLPVVFVAWGRQTGRLLVAAKWTLPLALPLLAIHGLLNVTYPVSFTWHGLPVREEGLAYAAAVGIRLWVFGAAIAFVSQLQRDQLFGALYRRKWMPQWALLLVSLSVSMFHYLWRRAQATSLAQRSRGLPRGPGLRTRMTSLFAVVLPLVAIAIVESTTRGHALSARGLGSKPLRLPDMQAAMPLDKGLLAVTLTICIATVLQGRL